MSDARKCEEYVSGGSSWSSRSRQCSKNAKSQEDGKWYCGTHLPSAVRAKKDAMEARWDAKWYAERAVRYKAEAAAAEQKRRADLYPELLAALMAMTDGCEYRSIGGDEPAWHTKTMPSSASLDLARIAITKATQGS